MIVVNRLKYANYLVSFDLEHDLFLPIGSALRRIILSSTPGKSIVKLSISSVNHEYESTTYTHDDIIDIASNFQKISFIMEEKSKSFTLKIKGPCIFTAKDITKQVQDIQVNAPDLVIMSVTEDKEFEVNCVVQEGYGIVYPSDQDNLLSNPISFNPVLDLTYEYHSPKIQFHVKMNGDIDPIYAFYNAFEVLQSCLFKITDCLNTSKDVNLISFTDIQLDTRIIHALEKANILSVKDITGLSQKHILSIPNIGKDSLKKIIDALQNIDIVLPEE